MSETNYFKVLNAINCSDKIEKKNGLSYLSWAWAWAEAKKFDPNANYAIYENADGWNYFTDGRTCWVKTGVTINGIEHIEYLPVMDFKNKSIPLESVTSFEVNKAIQRSLTKAVARHGLGLYIYAGEDLPEESDGIQNTTPKAKPKTTKKAEPVQDLPVELVYAGDLPVEVVSEPTFRSQLRAYCQTNKIDPRPIIKACGLNEKSTEEDYKKALAYAMRNGG